MTEYAWREIEKNAEAAADALRDGPLKTLRDMAFDLALANGDKGAAEALETAGAAKAAVQAAEAQLLTLKQHAADMWINFVQEDD